MSKNLKTFNETRNFNKMFFEMNKLMKNIENSVFLKKIQIKNEKIVNDAFSMNNRIDNMTRVMKKMILNVNAFMQKIVQKIQYSALFSSVSIQIARRFEIENQSTAASSAQIAKNMQLASRAESMYQNSQSMNFDVYQRYSKNDFFKFQNDKCLYYFSNDHILKKNVEIFKTT